MPIISEANKNSTDTGTNLESVVHGWEKETKTIWKICLKHKHSKMGKLTEIHIAFSQILHIENNSLNAIDSKTAEYNTPNEQYKRPVLFRMNGIETIYL